MALDINKIREDFPILKRKVNGNDFVYFDNAATSQKPNKVIDSIVDYYKNYNSVEYIDYFIKTHNIPNNPKTEGDLKKFIIKRVLTNVFIKFRKPDILCFFVFFI